MDNEEKHILKWLNELKKAFRNQELNNEKIIVANEFLESCIKYCNKTYEKDTIFYRARLYLEDDKGAKAKMLSTEIFQGYDKEKSFVNLKPMGNCRISNSNTRCLYVSNSIDTCIPEIGEYANSKVSVAEIKAIERLKIYNLSANVSVYTTDISKSQILPEIKDKSLLLRGIKDEFSKPAYDTEEDYLLTNFFASKIRELGFDGVQYASAYAINEGLNKRYNLGIFNYNKCEAINSKLYHVTNVKADYAKCEDVS